MRLFRSGCWQILAATVYLLPVVLTARAEEANRINARFEIYGLAGLHVLTEQTIVEETADRYTIRADLATRGLARIFVDLTSHSEVRGTLDGDNPSPSGYRADIRRNAPIDITVWTIAATAP